MQGLEESTHVRTDGRLEQIVGVDPRARDDVQDSIRR
jgi:hypothetical protein